VANLFDHSRLPHIRRLAVRRLLLEQLDVGEAAERLAAVVSPHRAGRRVGDREPVVDIGERAGEQPEVAVDSAAQLNNLAIAVDRSGRSAEAEALHRGALELRRWLAPADSPVLSESLNNLAVLLRRLGRDAEAEPLLREALEARRRIFGDHPRTANALQNLANTLTNLQRFGEAERLHREALAVRRKVLGERHSNVAMSLRDLGQTLSRRGRPTEAEALLAEAETMFVETLGATHEATAWTRSFRARLWCETGRASKGLPAMEEALQAIESGPAGNTPQLYEARIELARCLLELDQRERARGVLLEARGHLLGAGAAGEARLRAIDELLAEIG
jgi:tetratricopeptide (TPR) repeat protein